MKTTLRLEELAMAIAAVWLISRYNLHLPAWTWVLLFFAPDIGMLGYAINTKVGALSYNLLHHKGIAAAITVIGFVTHIDLLVASGALLFGHSSFDRVLGYGLKYSDSFQHTHLGTIGRK